MLSIHPIFQASERVLEQLLFHEPERATLLGVEGHDDRWADRSPDGHEALVDTVESCERELAGLPGATDRWDRLAVAVAAAELGSLRIHHETGEARRDLNSIASPFQDYRQTFDYAPRSSDADWANIARRLESLGDAMAGYLATLEYGASRGETVAARQIAEVIRQARVVESDRSPFLGLAREYGAGPLAGRLEVAIDAGRAAFGSFADGLESGLLRTAPDADAVGPERYARAVDHFVGDTIDLHEAYAWGWTEIAAILDRMRTVAGEIVSGGSIADAVHLLKTDPARSVDSQSAFVAFAQERIDAALGRLSGDHFDVPPQIMRCDVKMAPPGGALGAYYVSPSEDFTRPGTVWWSMGDDDRPIPLYDEVTTSYHEGFPGHHLQSGVQLTIADRLSRLHRLWVWKSGSGEGWALYAERLMDENGFLEEPDYVFGYLAAQMHRACRVVIDIGSHLRLAIPDGQPFHPGEQWTYDTGVEMLERYSTISRENARSEMNRFLGWPGQAIAYKIGEREILRLRDESRRPGGEVLTVRDFHARLLELGAIDMRLLRQFVLDE